MTDNNTNRDAAGNVIRKEHYDQVCVWPGTLVTDPSSDVPLTEQIKVFEECMAKDGMRVQYLEEIKTRPDQYPDKNEVPGTGGRNDLFFAMHKDDVGPNAVKRLAMGIRWIEDVLAPINYHSPIYPQRVFDYRSWPTDSRDMEPAQDPAPETAVELEATPNEEPKPKEDTLSRLAGLLIEMLEPKIKELVAAEVEQQLDALLDQPKFEGAVREALDVEALTHQIQKELDLDGLLDSNGFSDAVHDVVSSMEFSVSVESWRRRQY